MVILLKKALRSIWRGKRSYAACIFLIALGIASYVGFTQTSVQLLATLDNMYESQSFGDAFATVEGISPDAAPSLRRPEGVAQVSAYTSADVQVLHDGSETLSLHLLSYDATEDNPLNRFVVLEGSAPRRGEILVSYSFFLAQGLAVGDEISIIRDGRQMRPIVSGAAISPAYTSEVGTGMTGDGTVSGYGYMPTAEVDTLADSGGLADQLVILLDDGVTYEAMELLLEEALARYGLKDLYGRADHPSHKSTWDSFASLTSSAGMISFVFLAVSVLVLYILLRRVIEQERTQIGTMKAFGFSGGSILLLYLSYGAFTGLAGGILGCIGGMGIAVAFVRLYLSILFMPAIPMVSAAPLFLTALLLSFLAGIGGAVMGARHIMALSPAEAMRPAAPTIRTSKKRGKGSALLPPSISMGLRNISRGKFRSAFIAGGMALSFAILTFMSSYSSIMEEIMLVQYDKIQLYDMRLSLDEPKGWTAAVQSARGLADIDDAEGVLELPVTIYHDHLHTEVSLTGLAQDSSLLGIYDSGSSRYLPVPQQGAVISLTLANRLSAGVGDTLEIVTTYTGERRLPVTVTGIVNENMGSSAYMELGALSSLLGVEPTVNSLLLRTDAPAAVQELLTDAKNVNTLYNKQELRQSTQKMLDQSLGVNVGIFGAIGLGIAFAIIASSASISLSERSREYATLRVLGMSPGEIGKVLIFEYLLMTLLGFLPGIPLAIGFRALIMSAFASVDEAITVTPWIAASHYLVGGAICLVTSAIANLSSIKQISRLNMTDVLKERE